jgi:hypothetical protein
MANNNTGTGFEGSYLLLVHDHEAVALQHILRALVANPVTPTTTSSSQHHPISSTRKQ